MRDNKQLNQLIQQMENFQECLKQFNHYVNLTRAKFTPDDDSHFLETKSIIVQELELILASIQSGTPTREEVHALISSAPSLRFLSQLQVAWSGCGVWMIALGPTSFLMSSRMRSRVVSMVDLSGLTVPCV